jgi:hypothetical protein
MTTPKTIWDNFCTAHRISIDSVPLFASDEHGLVDTKEVGRASMRMVLVRQGLEGIGHQFHQLKRTATRIFLLRARLRLL